MKALITLTICLVAGAAQADEAVPASAAIGEVIATQMTRWTEAGRLYTEACNTEEAKDMFRIGLTTPECSYQNHLYLIESKILTDFIAASGQNVPKK